MLVRREAKHTVLYGDSVADVADYLSRTPKLWAASDARHSPARLSWDLNAGWEGAQRMARNGWSEGAKRLGAALDVLVPPNAKETETRYDVAGHFPDVSRFVAGVPDHMVRRGRVKGHAPVMNMVVALTTSCGVSAECYANFGAAMVNVIDKLEAGGRRVELSVMFPNALRATRCLAGWRVKAADEHCDLAAIAFSIAHPAAYRRLGFGLWEHTEQSNYMSGYGRCVPFTKADAEFMGFEEPLIVNGEMFALSECATPKAAARFATRQINAAAGETLVEVEK